MKMHKLTSTIKAIFFLSSTAFTVLFVPTTMSARGIKMPPGLWQEVTESTIGATEEWSNKVELADINGDEWVDILFANGGDYNSPGEPEPTRIFLNKGPGKPFHDATVEIFRDAKFLTRAVRVADVNSDGNVDLFLATSYQTQSQLYLGTGDGNFKNVTKKYLPQYSGSFGDGTFCDLDGDGDLDIALANWGPGDPFINAGGRTRMWLNDGRGNFSDVTESSLPDTKVKFSWDLDCVDVDNDFDLDIMVSAKMSNGGFLFINDGTGHFTDASERVPQYTNNYDYEVMDINGDGYLDVVTINDGEHVNLDDPYARRNHVFFNNRRGGFEDVTSQVLSRRDNPGVDDNLSVFLDFNSDGYPDYLIASLSGQDRLLINDGKGNFNLDDDLFNTFTYSGTPSHGTLGMAVADLNGDHKLDVVESQGEVDYPEKVYFGKNIALDTAPPIISLVEQTDSQGVVRARVHDNKSPTKPHDWQSVTLNWQADGIIGEANMQWYGEYLWRSSAPLPGGKSVTYQVCAIDAAGNSACSKSMRAKK